MPLELHRRDRPVFGDDPIVVSRVHPVPTEATFGEAGIAAVTDTLTSNTLSDAFEPLPGRTFYMVLTGTGSATVTALFSSDGGGTFMPEAIGVDGSAPRIMNKVAYDGSTLNGFRHPLQVDQAGVVVVAKPGAVSGAVTVTFEQ